MNFIIFGGSGFIGTHLIHLLKEECVQPGDKIYDLDIVLPGEEGCVPGIVEKNEGVDYIRCDVRYPIDFKFTPTKDDIVFNLAAVHRTPGHEAIEYFETNIRGAENITAFAEKYSINKILFTSSIAPYGASEDLKSEDSIPTPNTPYGISKLVAEKIHMIWANKDNSRELTILRPGIVYGKGEHGNMTRLFNAIKGHYYFYAGRKDTIKACVYVKELVNFIRYRMIENSFPGTDIFNCTFEPAYSIEQICEAMKSATGLSNRIPMLNGNLLIFVAKVLGAFGGKKLGIHPDRVKKLMVSTNISGKKLKSLPYVFHYNLEESFKDWNKDCSNRKLKVLQISNYYYPNIGGIEQTARDIGNALKSTGEIEQKVLCFNETARNGDVKCNRAETIHDYVDGIEIIRCGCITKKSSQSISLTLPLELRKVMKTFAPDVVVFHYPNPFESTFLMRYLKKKKFYFILYWHLDIVKQKFIGKFFEKQNNKLLEYADKIFATSPVYIEGSPYLSKFKDKCRVIPSCINSNRLTINNKIEEHANQIKQENEGKIICFAIGRHVLYKGFRYLVEASKYLDDRFRIYIGGTGELSSELKSLAKDDAKVSFLGRMSDEDLLAYYLAMDIFCFPSITKNEAFGLALAEAMSFGKPAVTFNIPGSGVNYVSVNCETGFEVTNSDSKKYAEALTLLASDSELRNKMGKNAKRRVQELFTEDIFRNHIISEFRKIDMVKQTGLY